MIKTPTFLFFLSCTISTFFLISSYRLLTDKKLESNLLNIIVSILGAILFCLNNLYSEPALRIVTTFLLTLIIYLIVFRDNVRRTLIINVQLNVLGLLADMIVPLLIINLFGIIYPENNYESEILFKSLFNIIVPSMLFLVITIPTMNEKLKKMEEYFSSKSYDVIFSIFILLAINAVGAFAIYTVKDRRTNLYTLIIISFVSGMAVLYLKNRKSETLLRIINKSQGDKIKLYNTLVEDYRVLKHNMINQLLAIRSVANKDAQGLIDDRLNNYESNVDIITCIENAPPGIRNLLYIKLNQLNKSKEVTVNVECDMEHDIVANLKPEIYNILSESIGICLDNAMYSVGHKGIINIRIYESTNFLFVEITNTFSGMLDIDNFGNINYTTKTNGHGIGVSSILRNSKIKYVSKICNNKFISTLKVKLNK